MCVSRSEKAFYLRDFAGATEAERHKGAIAAAQGWRSMMFAKINFRPKSKGGAAGPVLRTDMSPWIKKYADGKISLAELFLVLPLWWVQGMKYVQQRGVREGWVKLKSPGSKSKSTPAERPAADAEDEAGHGGA